jgi:hypothetical protein
MGPRFYRRQPLGPSGKTRPTGSSIGIHFIDAVTGALLLIKAQEDPISDYIRMLCGVVPCNVLRVSPASDAMKPTISMGVVL